jgi:hypothetical protein
VPLYQYICTDKEACFVRIIFVLIANHSWNKECTDKEAWARASLSVQCTDNEVCTDKFCTDSESDKGGSRYPYCTDNETLVYALF